jgi:cysteine desulfuration protein SufE
MSLETLLDDFDLFDDWEERYRYIIELGNGLKPLSDEEHNEANKVQGCVSQVWLVNDRDGDALSFRGDSDAHIVRGLVAILLNLYEGKSPQEISDYDAEGAFQKLGFYAMVQRIRTDAAATLAD